MPRIVRIIPSICSTATGDFVFFATGEKDYSKLPAMRSRFSKGEITIGIA
jgi:hypothetical protein